MPVTLTVADVTYPIGELQASMFPANDLATSAASWLSQNEVTGSGDNIAARHWLYYRAYDAIASRLSNSPSVINVDGTVTRTISAAQIKYYTDKAQSNLMEYNRLTNNESFELLKPSKFRSF